VSALVQAELRRATSRRLVRVLAALGALGAVIVGGVAYVRTGGDSHYEAQQLADLLRGTSGILALLGWVLGASLIGAEHQSRGLTTTLIFVPQRGRVFASKAVAAVSVAAVWSLATLTAIGLALLPAVLAHGTDGMAGPGVGDVAAIVLRGAGLAGFAAALGFAIASLGRNTAVALGFGFAYLMVFENILGEALRGWRSWLLLGNTIIWISGEDQTDIPGRGLVGAGVFLGLVALVLMLVSAAAFRTRDVA
jgi:ABC-type transport system involved in multi-copper enzyme maturation permease subunit